MVHFNPFTLNVPLRDICQTEFMTLWMYTLFPIILEGELLGLLRLYFSSIDIQINASDRERSNYNKVM